MTAEELLNMVNDDIEAYEESKDEDYRAREYIRGNQLSNQVIKALEDRGQPIQIYNVFDEYINKKIKGYFSSIDQSPTAKPTQDIDAVQATVASDLLTYELYKNGWPKRRAKAIWELALTGLSCLYMDVRKTDQTDQYGRAVYDIRIENVPSIEMYPDRLSTKADYSDSRRFSRFKWVHKNEIREKFPDFDMDEITSSSGENYTDDDYLDFTTRFRQTSFETSAHETDMYLLAHTVTKEWVEDKEVWVSYYWVKGTIIDRKEMVYEFLEQPYICQKLFETDTPGYYGLMHDHFGTQDAINQAIQQIQLMISSVRAIVEEGSIPSNITLEQFKGLVFRPNSLIPVKNITGLQLDKLVTEIQHYYVAIDRYLDIIQRSIGINDAFMGFAPASSSGKKVQVQQQAAVVALEYFATPLADITKKVGENIIAFARQYYRAYQLLRVTDKSVGEKYVEINKPMTTPLVINGQPVKDFSGQQIEVPFVRIATDPETEELLKDDNGDYILEPANDPSTALGIGKYDIMVITGPSGIGEVEERDNLLNILQIGSGSMPPQTAMKTMGYLAREMKTPGASEISEDLLEASSKIEQQQEASVAQQINAQQLENIKKSQEIEGEGGEVVL